MEPTTIALEGLPVEQGFDIFSIIAMGAGMFVFMLALCVFMLIVNWKFFQKAGYKGYESLIPIHNFIVTIQIAGKPMWYFFLMFIPIVNIILMVKILNGISKAFGRGSGFTWGLILLPIVFFPLLVWGKEESVERKENDGESGMSREEIQNIPVESVVNNSLPPVPPVI
jgi:hypothetical protein